MSKASARESLVLDARFEKLRVDGSLRDCAVLAAIGVAEDGRRSVLGTNCALSEAEVHWLGILESLQHAILRAPNKLTAQTLLRQIGGNSLQKRPGELAVWLETNALRASPFLTYEVDPVLRPGTG